MEDSSLSLPNPSSSVIELDPTDVANCLALSMDPRAEEVMNLTMRIEEYLGLEPDREVRMERLHSLRNQAQVQNINPVITASFSMEVDKYCQTLRNKVSILENMINCCDNFVSRVDQEMRLLDYKLQGDKATRDAVTSNYCHKRSSYLMVSESDKRQKRNRLPSAALHILWDFMRTHKGNPYPTTQQKESLAKKTNLTITQIRNWFTNTRKRKFSQSTDSDDEYSVESDQGDPTFSPGYSTSSSSSSSRYRNKRGKRKQSMDNSVYDCKPSGFLPVCNGENGVSMNSSLSSSSTAIANIQNTEFSLHSTPSSTSTVNGTWTSFADDTIAPFPVLSTRNHSISSANHLYEEEEGLGLNLLLTPGTPQSGLSPLPLNEDEFFLNNDVVFSFKKNVL